MPYEPHACHPTESVRLTMDRHIRTMAMRNRNGGRAL